MVSHSAPTSGVMSSGRAPRRVPSTGVPEKNASIVTSPNGSSHAAGFHRHRARASSAALVVDRKSTRLNSSHGYISYAVFCLKKKNQCFDVQRQVLRAAQCTLHLPVRV